MNRLTKNLDALQALTGLSGNALAEAASIAQPTYQRILKGVSKDPKDKNLMPLADYFGVTVEQLKRHDLTTEDAVSGIVSHLAATSPKQSAFDRKLQATWVVKSLEQDIDQLRQTVLNLVDVITAKIPGAIDALDELHQAVPDHHARKGFHGSVSQALQSHKQRAARALDDAAPRAARKSSGSS